MADKKGVFNNEADKSNFVSKKDGFLEPEEHTESSEDMESEMETGQRDTDVYTVEGQNNLVENDEIAPWEEGFSEGAEGNVDYDHCANCQQVLSGEDFIEREITPGKILAFCSEDCVNDYVQKKKA